MQNDRELKPSGWPGKETRRRPPLAGASRLSRSPRYLNLKLARYDSPSLSITINWRQPVQAFSVFQT